MAAERGRGSAGFSLAEVLATLAIAAAILSGLFSLTSLVSRQTQRVAARVEETETAGRMLAAVSRDIARAARVRWAAGLPRGFVFRGERDRILFALDRPDAASAPTIAVQLQSVPGALLRAQAPLPPDSVSAETLPFGSAVPLYEGPLELRFAYLADGAPETPLDRWSRPDAMPAAVRVTAVDARTGAVHASLGVPLRITAEAGCAAPEKAFCSRFEPMAEASGRPKPGRATGRADVL